MTTHIRIQGSVFLKTHILTIHCFEEYELEVSLLDGSVHVFEFMGNEAIDAWLNKHF